MKPVERLPVYENLFALNRDFEQVLIALARLEKFGVFGDLGHITNVIVKKTRAQINMQIVAFLQAREEDAGAWWDRLHVRWEKRMKDPNDVLIEAKLLLEKRRKAAANKSRRKQRGARSEGV